MHRDDSEDDCGNDYAEIETAKMTVEMTTRRLKGGDEQLTRKNQKISISERLIRRIHTPGSLATKFLVVSDPHTDVYIFT